MRAAGSSVVAVLLLLGCDGSLQPMEEGLCAVDEPPAACGTACSAADPCPAGFYCSDEGICTADCDRRSEASACPPDRCAADGRCMGGGDGMDAGGRSDGGGNGCADVRVEARRVTPNVVLVIDQSGSMDVSFGESDRWNALRDSLLDRPDGLVFALQEQVRFGLALFSAEAEGGSSEPVPGECPLIEWIPPALSSYESIAAVYGAAEPIDETPTGASLDAVTDRLTMTPDPSADPTIFILATDGEPDTCAQPNPQEGQPEALAAAERAFTAGIRTFIISVGEGTISEVHLQDMANAGLGRTASDPDAEYWVAGDDAGLRSALTEIIGEQLSCEITLEGAIQDLDEACSGDVRLNGRSLRCDDPNGWRALDASRIEILGDACETLQNATGAVVTATFPCDVVLI